MIQMKRRPWLSAMKDYLQPFEFGNEQRIYNLLFMGNTSNWEDIS